MRTALTLLAVLATATLAIGQEKRGAAAYDAYPEPWKERFLKDYQTEVDFVRKYLTEVGPRTPKGQELKARLDRLERNDPPFFHLWELTVKGLKVGQHGQAREIRGKVIQVIDGEKMLVGVEDPLPPVGRYPTWIMLKAPTAGLTDGKEFGKNWKELVGTDVLYIASTVTYTTAIGGTRTVFVVEPLDLEKLKKKE